MKDSPQKSGRFLEYLLKNVNKICLGSYVIGVLAFLALPYHDLSENHYHSENALLTGLQHSNFGRNGAFEAYNYNEMVTEVFNDGDKRAVQDKLVTLMQEFGINAYKQSFQFKSPMPDIKDGNILQKVKNGTNVYGFIRAGRASSTESIVLNIPLFKGRYNHAIGLALAFGKEIRGQPYWAKDIVLLFTEMEYIGAQAWLQSYYDARNNDFIQSDPLEERAGSILAAIIVDLPERMGHINAEVVGNNGQLPNLDLFNVLTKLSKSHGMMVAVGGELTKLIYNPQSINGYLQSLKMTVKMMSKQAKGFSSINHAMFLQYNIQSLSIQGKKGATELHKKPDLASVGRVVEGIFRSLNNLLEKLHHSYFFYLISAIDRFISIVLYMPPFGLMLLAPTLKALLLYIGMKKAAEKQKEEQNSEVEEEVPPSIEDLRKSDKDDNSTSEERESGWLDLFYILAMTHLLGVGLYYSPMFATTWSSMYNLSADDSLILIFLSVYIAAIFLPFSSVIGFSQDAKVLDMLRVTALVLYAVILGCVAVMNFSLAMVIALISAPLITFITPHAKKSKPLCVVMSLLASPVSVSLILMFMNRYFFGIKTDVVMSAKNILKSPYEQSLLGNSWNYEFACLILYPNWILFWFLAVARPRQR